MPSDSLHLVHNASHDRTAEAGPSAPPAAPPPPPRRVTMPRHTIPMDHLILRHDPSQHPDGTLVTLEENRRLRRDVRWSQRREYLLAAAAAGIHVLLFAYNLAFWGFEGMPPDRYWPDNPRIRLQLRPGRYGNLRGAKKLWYYYLGKIEGTGTSK